MAEAVIAYDRELPEIPDRRPWERPAPYLVKDGGAWRIAAQAWDTEQDGRKIPDDLLASTMSSRPR